MVTAPTSAADYLPPRHTLPQLRAAAPACRGCELYKHATQVVFGAGTSRATIMLVGEQPGDQEDLLGEPFVGPAGRILDDGLERAGIDRRGVYVTNAVKHFRFLMRGKRRIHKKPTAAHIRACLPWLEAEVDAVKPRVIVPLGATAARAIMGPSFRVTRQHGQPHQAWQRTVVATLHPSSILRRRTEEERHAAMDEFVADLVAAREAGA
jgi:DNA polymerase